jgi:3'-5' exoribonuclease
MRRFYLSYASAGDVIDDVYVLSSKQLSTTNTGKHFIKGFVSDRTAQVTARMWNASKRDFDRLPQNGFVRIRGRIENYQQNLQLIIDSYDDPAEGSYDVADLLPHTDKDIDAMWARLVELCESLQNRHVAAIVQSYLDDAALMSDFRRAPAAMNFHHAYLGGLLEHTLNAMEVADAVVRFYPGLNRDLVLAGIFLHDIAKCWELTYDTAFGYSDGGQLVGHIVKSALWLQDKVKVAADTLGEPIPQPLVDVLQHIILSHHGVPEFGAVKVPSTPEAIAVHVIENLDAKLMMALVNCRGDLGPGAEGNWTEYLKAFNGRLYRPDVAPADAPIADAGATPTSPSAATPPAPPASRPAAAAATPPRPAPSAAKAPADLTIRNPAFQIDPPKKS